MIDVTDTAFAPVVARAWEIQETHPGALPRVVAKLYRLEVAAQGHASEETLDALETIAFQAVVNG